LRFTDARPLARCRPSGVPRRDDVDCCVDVRVAGEAAGGTTEPGLALARVLVYPTALLGEARGGLAARTPVPVLLNSEVPHVPGVRAVPEQALLLRRSRVSAVAGHENIIPENYDQGACIATSQPGFAGLRIPLRPEGRSPLRKFGWCGLSAREVRAGWNEGDLAAVRAKAGLEERLGALPQARHERRPA
jgi:hypothetical protein